MSDGYRLPLRRWGADERPRALVLALHGFNDYSNAFATLGPYLATQSVLTFAYDQRGFGTTTQRGLWGGKKRLTADLKTLTELLRERYPAPPCYCSGRAWAARWSWSPRHRRIRDKWVLKVAAHTLPSLELTGSGLDIRPSDNDDMLRAFRADPLVIKETRVDALWGITNLMDLAMVGAVRLPGPTLLLYGEHGKIISDGAFCALLDRIPVNRQDIRILLYREGWHMLTRDLQGKRVMADIAVWLQSRDGYSPSGEEVRAGSRRLECFCQS